MFYFQLKEKIVTILLDNIIRSKMEKTNLLNNKLEELFGDAIKICKPQIYAYLNENPKGKSVLQTHPNIMDTKMFVCRSQIGYLVFNNVDDFQNFERAVPQEHKQFHEVIFSKRPQKPRWDIDCDPSKISYDQFVLLIDTIIEQSNQILNKYENNEYTKEDWIICTSFGEDVKKYSAHLIFGPSVYFYDSYDAKGFHEYILSKIFNETNPIISLDYRLFVDIQVYKTIQNFRILGSCKSDALDRIKIVNNDLKNPKIEKTHNDIFSLLESLDDKNTNTMIDTLIGYYGDSSEMMNFNEEPEFNNVYKYGNYAHNIILPDWFGKALREKATSKNIIPIVPNDQVQKAVNLILEKYPEHEYRSSQGNFINFWRKSNSMCSFCGREHENDNTLYAIIGPTIRVGCFRYNNDKKNPKKKWDLIHTEDTKKEIDQIAKQDENKTTDKKDMYIPSRMITQAIEGYRWKVDLSAKNPKDKFQKISMNYLRSPSIPVDAIGGEKTINHIQGCHSDVCDFNLGLHRTIIVKSPMGSGKSVWIRKLLKDTDINVVMLSFRISFTNDIGTKMKSLGFISYNDESIPMGKPINISKHNRVVIQFESLNRLKMDDKPFLLLLDESESIFNQVSSKLNQRR